MAPAKATLAEVDRKVLSDKKTSELGRFAVTKGLDDLGSFKTPTLRNVAVTAPYMHDGSLATLKDVIVHWIAFLRSSSAAQFNGKAEALHTGLTSPSTAFTTARATLAMAASPP